MADLSERTVQDLIDAIIALTNQMGRGIGAPNGKGSSRGISGNSNTTSGSGALDKKMKKVGETFEKFQKKIDDGIKLTANQTKEYARLGKQLDEYNKSAKSATDATKDLSDGLRENTYLQEKQSKGVKKFGKELLLGTGSVGDAFGNLASNLNTSNGIANKALFGFATGASFALSAMTDFAKNASEVGAFADLGAFRVGSIQQAKVLSGLGDSFIKAIAESKGGFKALGEGSQDAVENLSTLSRGLRNGAKFAPLLGYQLGKEFRDDLNRASIAVSRLGLSAEDQADLTGTIVNTVAMSGKRGDDAIKEVAKQFRATAENARTLSNAFGISVKDIIASVKEFRESLAGRATALEGGGGEGAGNILPLIKQLALNSDPQKQALIAKAISEGDYAGAAANTDQYSRQNLDILYKAVQSSGGGADKDKLAKAMQDSADEFTDASKDASRRQALYYTPEYAAPAVAAGELGQRLKLGKSTTEADKDKNTFMTSEADNIKTMNMLNGTLDALRGSIIGLTGVMVGILGMLTPLVAGAITSGFVSGKSMKELAVGVKDFGVGLWTSTKEIWNSAGGISGLGKSLKSYTGMMLNTTKALYEQAGGFSGMYDSVKKYVSSYTGMMWNTTKALYEQVGGISGLGKSLKSYTGKMWNTTKAVAGEAADAIGSFSKETWKNIGGLSGIGNSIKNFGTKIAGYAMQAGKSLVAMGVTIWQTVVPALIAMAESAWASIVGGFGKLGKFLGPVSGWFGKLVPVLGRVGGFLASWGSKLLPMLGGAFEILTGPIGWLIGGATLLYAFWDDIVDVSKALWKGFTGLVDWLTDGISAVWNGITGVISSAFGGLVDILSSGASAIWSVITAPFSALFDWLGNSWLGKKLGFGSSDATPTDTKSTPTDTKSTSATPTANASDSTSPTSSLLQNQTPGQITRTITQDQFASIATPNGINNNFGNIGTNNNNNNATGNTAQNNLSTNLQNAITPEMITTAIKYLQNMANDLEAIRSNTRSSDSGGTVRMS